MNNYDKVCVDTNNSINKNYNFKYNTNMYKTKPESCNSSYCNSGSRSLKNYEGPSNNWGWGNKKSMNRNMHDMKNKNLDMGMHMHGKTMMMNHEMKSMNKNFNMGSGDNGDFVTICPRN